LDSPERYELFHEILAQPILDWSRRFAENARLQKQYALADRLDRATRELHATSGLRSVAEAIVTRTISLVNFEAAALFAKDGESTLFRLQAASGFSDETKRLWSEAAPEIVGDVAKSGLSVVLG